MILPLRDLLILDPITQPGKEGTLFIPDRGNLRDATGGYCRVVAAGPKCIIVKVGDTVHVKAYGAHYAGDEVYLEGKKYVLIKERDINGVCV